jgi:hypothetical protein
MGMMGRLKLGIAERVEQAFAPDITLEQLPGGRWVPKVRDLALFRQIADLAGLRRWISIHTAELGAFGEAAGRLGLTVEEVSLEVDESGWDYNVYGDKDPEVLGERRGS